MDNSHPLVRSCRFFSRLASLIVFLIGCLVLAGWLFDIAILKSILPGWVSMRVNTALAFVFCGLGLWFFNAEMEQANLLARRLVQAFAFAVVMIGLVSLGKMDPVSALNFILVGAALLILGARLNLGFAQGLVLVVIFLALLAFVDYLCEVSSLYGFAVFTKMAPHTAIVFLILGVGALSALPEQGLFGILTSETVGGVTARRLLPAAIGSPIVLALLSIGGQGVGFYAMNFGVALHVVSSIFIFASVVLWNAAWLAQMDTQRRRAEELLLASEKHTQSILETADDAFVSMDSGGLVRVWNRQAATIFGWSAEEVFGRSLAELIIPPLHRTSFRQSLKQFLETGGEDHVLNKQTEITAVHRDGHAFPVELTTWALHTGQTFNFNSFIRDITERKRTEKALRESEQRYRSLFDSIDEGFCIIEMIFDKHEKPVDYRFLQVNPSFEKQTGLKDAQGKRMRDLAPQHESHWFEIYGKIALTGQPARFENPAKQLRRWYDVYAFRYGEPENRQVGVLFNDITERKRVEDELKQKTLELERSNGELEEFAYAVSHDLKAPLRGISHLSEWLVQDYGDKLDEEGKKQLGMLHNRACYMQTLIGGILEYSRIGRVRENVMDIDLNDLIAQALDLLQPSPEIHIEVPDNLPIIHAEKARMHQLFQNLLGNAIKFMDKPKGHIRVGCEDNGAMWRFSVSDNGPGIEEKYFDRIFQLFQTLGTHEEEGSTGVGLALVKKIVDLYGGSIQVQSEIGKGSTFFFTLPKSKANEEG